MPRLRYAIALGLAALSCAGVAGAAVSARQPTFKEREAITAAMPGWLRSYPVGCVWLATTVSRDGKWAKVAPRFLNATKGPCVRYASDGFWILKKTATWKIVFNGSVPPPCSLKVPRNLEPEPCMHP